jgi:ribosomal silencing factor RsfS
MVGVIIKREYPGLVDDKDQNGVVLNTRPALEWADYFVIPKDKNRQTARDRVISEFWVSNMNFV